MATGKDRTIPQKPAIIPPAETEKITSNGCKELVLPYTLGPITLPSRIGHTMQMTTVNKNNLVLITDEINSDKIATMKPPNHGIIAENPERIPKIK